MEGGVPDLKQLELALAFTRKRKHFSITGGFRWAQSEGGPSFLETLTLEPWVKTRERKSQRQSNSLFGLTIRPPRISWASPIWPSQPSTRSSATSSIPLPVCTHRIGKGTTPFGAAQTPELIERRRLRSTNQPTRPVDRPVARRAHHRPAGLDADPAGDPGDELRSGRASMARGQYWIHPAMPELIENALLNLPLD